MESTRVAELIDTGVTFGGYRFVPATGRLFLGQQEVRLTPKAAAVLSALVAQRGQPVTRDQLFASVWGDTAVSDDALTSCIKELRRAFGDDSRRPHFIETRHRRGYRFMPPISEFGGTSPTTAPPNGSTAERALDTTARATPATARIAGSPTIAGAPLAPAPPRAGDSPLRGHDISAIAVLPFADMSPGHDQDYMCDGLAEELINALTHIDGLRVAARTASFQFRDAGADVQAVGRLLGVGTLLEGSVRKADDRLRVVVQLIEVETGYHRWSQRFDRKVDDVFAIQDEIAEQVAMSLRSSVLSHREKQALARPQTGADAYEYYLRGRQHLPRIVRPDLMRSGDMFARAIALDANYGPAWAGLATVHATLYEWFGTKDEDLAQAECASRRALELAPYLAEAHVARGCVLSLARKYDDAARAFEDAIRLNPRLFDAYYYYGRISVARGDALRAVELFRKAADARQEDVQSPMFLSQSLRSLGRADEARAAGREGIRRAEHMLVLNPVDVRALTLGSVALFEDRQQARALAWSERSLELYPDDVCVVANAACLRGKRGEKDEALALLERVFALGLGHRDWVEHDPDYDSLRDDPRFKKLLANLK